jgi:diguanylate cyclase (GGDEF)-like protein
MTIHERPTTAPVTPPQYLLSALDQSEHVKQKVEECAETLSSVTAVLKEEVGGHLPLEIIAGALNRSEEIEQKVQQCADDLASINLALAREISERKFLEGELFRSKIEQQRMRQLAFHDAVTGLPNRSLFSDRLRHALAQVQRHQRGIALLFIDLNNFKQVNDQYGHAVGDEVLRCIADRLRTSVRTEDTVSRHGGDEFMCLLLEVVDREHAVTIVEKIVRNLTQPCVIGNVRLNVAVSVGVTLAPADGNHPEALINNADAAMYIAKRNAKSGADTRGYRFFQEGGE